MSIIDAGRLLWVSSRSTLSLLVLFSILSVMTSFAEAEDKPHQSNSMAAIPDLIVVRPVAAVGSVLSTAVFTVTLPFTYHDNNGFDMLHFWVVKPWRFVSDRPLGVWETRESPAIQLIREMENRYSGISGRISADSQLEKIR